MKRISKNRVSMPAALLVGALYGIAPLAAGTAELVIRESRIELRPGFSTDAWTYGGTAPGTAVTADVGERMTIRVTNRLAVPTNIHWHGLVVPADQDGPAVYIAPGETYTYDFTVKAAGTYWYHSHYRPALGQVDRGLYGAFIVRDPTDRLYSGDSTFVLDDWLLDGDGNRIEGTAAGAMERIGTIETANGKTGDAIPALVLTKGELRKLRFINASTAVVHTLSITGHVFRVTHTDGHPLTEPYLTDTITLSPGERIDAELAATGRPGAEYAITGNGGGKGMKIILRYTREVVSPVASPFVPPAAQGFPGLGWKSPDAVLVFDSVSDTLSSTHSSDGGTALGAGAHERPEAGTGLPGTPAADASGTDGSAMGGMNMQAGMVWTVNGKSYPDTDPVPVKTGKVVKLRLKNTDTEGAHPMDHPIHIHGTVFQVLSANGKAPERELWKDTVVVPAGEYVDIAFIMENPGNWMLHCHILDHEDGGMMTVVRAR